MQWIRRSGEPDRFAIAVGVCLLQPLCDGREVFAHVVDREPGLTPPKQVHHAAVTIGYDPRAIRAGRRGHIYIVLVRVLRERRKHADIPMENKR